MTELLQKGLRLAGKTFDDFVKGDRAYYSFVEGKLSDERADFWSMTELFSLAVRLYETTGDISYIEKVREILAYYRGKRSDNPLNEPFWVYAVHPGDIKNACDVYGKRGEESVFDDQIWLGIDLVKAYNVDGRREFLTEAEHLARYVFEVGEDKKLGGIYWGQAYTSRHACSSCPYVLLACLLFKATGKETYLEQAKRVYDFCLKKLCDTDGTISDLIRTEYVDEKDIRHGGTSKCDGEVDKTKYTYNTGTFIEGGALLYELTGQKEYLLQAEASAKGARERFGKTKFGMTVYEGSRGEKNLTWFNLILFKGFEELYRQNGDDRYLKELPEAYLYDIKTHEKEGLYPFDGAVGWSEGRNTVENRHLQDQASLAEIMIMIGKQNEYDLNQRR